MKKHFIAKHYFQSPFLSTFYALLFLLSLNLTAQTTFNKRFHLGFPSTQLTNIISTDSCYYAIGIIADSIFPYRTGNIFLKLDLEGNVLIEKTITNTNKTYETWLPTLTSTQDGHFAAAGYSLDSTLNAILLKYNSEGDTLLFRQYLSPFHPQEPFMSPYGFVETIDSGFLCVNWVRNPSGIDNAEISIFRTDSIGTLTWHNSYGTELWDRPSSALSLGNTDTYLIGAVQQNINFVNSDYSSRTHIFKIDNLGHTIWDYLSPPDQLQDAANSMVTTPDDGLVVATQKGVEISTSPGNGNLYWKSGLIFKLNVNRELEWEVEFRDPSHPIRFNKLNKVLMTSDGSGFVAAGHSYERYSNFTADLHGWLVKASVDGDSLWSRRFHYLETEEDGHYIYDVKETTDGGFIMSGMARDFSASSQEQQAWLVKVDEHGCLVPGCHLASTVYESEQNAFNISLYPNPTSDFLNIYFKEKATSKSGLFRVINAEGKVMTSFVSVQNDITHILPVYSWSNGIYFLQYLVNYKIVFSEKVIISH